MTIDQLIESADLLKQPSKESSTEYASKSSLLLSKLNLKMIAQSNIESIIGGSVNLSLMEANHANHVRFVESIINNYNSKALVDNIGWVLRAYQSRSFKIEYWVLQLNTWIDLIKKELSKKSSDEILPIYIWMLENISEFEVIESN